MAQVKSFVFSPFMENTYVLYDETNEAIIIDPGCLTQAEKEQLVNFISDNRLIVKHLLQTHCHLDHVFGSAFVKRKYGVKMYIHPKEEAILADVEIRCKLWGIAGYEPVEADEFIDENDTISFGNTILEIRFVPGHAPGHIAFVNHADKFVISGDVLFRNSIGRYDLPFASYEDLMRSIKTQLMTLPDDYVVYAGHNEPTTIGYERETNPFLK